MEYVIHSKTMPCYLVGLGVAGIAGVLAIAVFAGVRLTSASASTPPIVVKMIDMPATYEAARITIKVGDTVE